LFGFDLDSGEEGYETEFDECKNINNCTAHITPDSMCGARYYLK